MGSSKLNVGTRVVGLGLQIGIEKGPLKIEGAGIGVGEWYGRGVQKRSACAQIDCQGYPIHAPRALSLQVKLLQWLLMMMTMMMNLKNLIEQQWSH